ncbi:MAG: hypothetical protein H7039_06560, partial [Bryobacteraceae bacterium]|nr:hypothetical protein [Bryobacteraceae bacterium]
MKAVQLATILIAGSRIASGGVPPLPLLFETTETGYIARTRGGSVSVDSKGAVLRSETGAVRLELQGATAVRPVPESPLDSVSNYLRGPDPAQWRSRVQHFGKVRSRSVYPGVDLVYYGREGEVEYDFVLAPGASARRIAMRVRGASKLKLDPTGALVIETPSTTFRQLRPVAYQLASDGRHESVEVS